MELNLLEAFSKFFFFLSISMYSVYCCISIYTYRFRYALSYKLVYNVKSGNVHESVKMKINCYYRLYVFSFYYIL